MSRRQKSKEPRQPLNPGFKDYRLRARTDGQQELIDKIQENVVTLCSGPPGSGKTHIAVGLAVKALKMGHVDKVVLTRPAVESSASLGYLPGDLTQKMAAYLIPLFDELSYFLEKRLIEKWMTDGVIEICPVGFFRGRTFKRTFVIVDEAQNLELRELRTVLTRVGEDAQLVMVGDTKQSDIMNSGFKDVVGMLDGVDNLAVVRLQYIDVVRSQIVIDMEKRFNE